MMALRSRIRKVQMLRLEKKIEVYQTVEDFAEDVSDERVSDKVELDNVRNLFLYFGGILMLILIGFIFQVLLFKRLQVTCRKLVRRLANFFFLFQESPFIRIGNRLKSLNLWSRKKKTKRQKPRRTVWLKMFRVYFR